MHELGSKKIKRSSKSSIAFRIHHIMAVGVVCVFEYGQLPRDRVAVRADPGGGESGMGIHVCRDNG